MITTMLWSQLKKLNDVAAGEPPMLPGGLPVLGHAVSLVRDASALHARARLVLLVSYKHTDQVSDVRIRIGSGRRACVQYRYP